MAPALRSTYHLSLGQTGVLISGSLVGSVVSLIPWGSRPTGWASGSCS